MLPTPVGAGSTVFLESKGSRATRALAVEDPTLSPSLATNRSASQYGVEIARDVDQGLLFG